MVIANRKNQEADDSLLSAGRLQIRQPHQVSIYRKICKCLPFEVTNKRVKGWEHCRSLPDGSKLNMEAKETITPGDMFVLIAAIKVLQDFPEKITETMIQDAAILEITINYRLFITKYVNHSNKEKLKQSLKRLASFKIYWEKIDGESIPHRYLYEFSIDKGAKNICFSISKKFVFYCDRYGWLVNFSKLQEISSPTARALFLYFAANSGKIFKQATLEHWLDMPGGTSIKSRDNRKQIKRALEELLKVGVLNDFSFENDSVHIVQSRHKNKIMHNKKKTLPPHKKDTAAT